MITIKNERGVALVFVLILSLIGLAIVSSLIYMITVGTQSSGAEKFYRTADEAALGGARIGTDLVIDNLSSFDDYASALAGGALSAPLAVALGTALDDTTNCLKQKLFLPPGVAFANWPGCTPILNRTNMDPSDTWDMRFQLTGLPPNDYFVFAKIVDTIEGNTAGLASGGSSGGGAAGTGSGGGLSTGGVGGGGASIVTPPRRSWMYRIEVQAEDAVNPRERARYSVLYAH